VLVEKGLVAAAAVEESAAPPPLVATAVMGGGADGRRDSCSPSDIGATGRC
jgi:hypothetical protein